MLTWMDVLAAVVAALIALTYIAVIAGALLLIGYSGRVILRARRRSQPPRCACGRLVLPAGSDHIDHIDHSPVRHAAGLCQPLREVIGR
jgi:hypothetical protein